MKLKKLIPAVLLTCLCLSVSAQKDWTAAGKGNCRKCRHTAWRSCRGQCWSAQHPAIGGHCDGEQYKGCLYKCFFYDG